MPINSEVPVQLHPDLNKGDMTAYINENFRKFTSLIDVLNFSKPDAAWVTPTFQNSWVNYGSGYNDAKYRKDALGYVNIKGLVKSGTISTTLPIFTLPAGYRPAQRYLFNAQSNGALGRVDVDTDGKVIPLTGNNAWVSLDGIRFLAEA